MTAPDTDNCPANPEGTQSTYLACYIDQYNNAIMAIFQQNLAGLQQAYTMEATVNYLNYVNGQNNGGDNQINNFSGIETVTYKCSTCSSTYDASTEQTNLEAAQVALAKLYAARINQLFQSTLEYIVSDQPIINAGVVDQNVTWMTKLTLNPDATSSDADTTNEIQNAMTNHPYSGFISLAKPAKTLAGTNNNSMPTITTNDYMFYQYFGLNQMYQCAYSNALIESGVSSAPLTATTCPPLFPQSNTATWDGINLDVYYGYDGTSVDSEPLLTDSIEPATVTRDGSQMFLLYTQDLTSGTVWALLPWSINPSNPIYDGPHDLSGTGNIYFDFDPVKHHYLQITYDIINTYLSSSPPEGDLITVNSDAGSGVVQTVDAKESHYSNLMFYILNQYNTPTSQSDDDAFVGAFYVVGINNGSGNWNIYLTCPTENPTFCTIEDNGICSGGRTLQLSGSHDCTGENWCVNVVAGSDGSCQN